MANRFFPNYKNYKITSPYGMRTLRGETRMHNGIDLVAKTTSGGSAVDYITAHTGGTVYAVGYGTSTGYYVKIRTDPETIMVYFHLREQSKLKKGDTVKTGQQIGYMGSTGNSTGAHLHWGIQRSGKWIDPTPYLDADYTAAPKMVFVSLPLLKQGTEHEAVKTMQHLLNQHGHDIAEDCIFGPATGAALEDFQRKNGLTPDKICGPATWAKLIAG